MSNNLKLLGALLIGIGLVLGVVAQFVPSAERGGGFGSEEAFPWGTESSGIGGSQSKNWFEAEDDNGDNIAALQAQLVLYYAALTFGLVALLAGVLGSSNNVGFIGIFAFLLLLVAIILFATGIDEAYDGTMDMAAGFYLTIAACGSFLVGGVVSKLR